MQNQQKSNEEIGITLSVDGALMETGFSFTYKPDYNVSEAEFKDLNSPPRTCDWLSAGLFILGITLLLTSFSKYLVSTAEISPQINFEMWEVLAGSIALLAGFCIWLFGYFTANPKKVVMNKMENHFKSYSPSQKFVRSTRDK